MPDPMSTTPIAEPASLPRLGSTEKRQPLDLRKVSFAPQSPEALAEISKLRATGARLHVVMTHPDGSATILLDKRPPIWRPAYVPRYAKR